MTGRNNRPDNDGVTGHPSRIDQYRSEFSTDMQQSLGEKRDEEDLDEILEDGVQ